MMQTVWCIQQNSRHAQAGQHGEHATGTHTT